jgi:hypothetical protein
MTKHMEWSIFVNMFVEDLFLFPLKDKPFLFFLTLALIEPINDVVPCAVFLLSFDNYGGYFHL